MSRRYLVTLIVTAILSSSMMPARRAGMLTDNYGLVTKADLDEDENECRNIRPLDIKNPHLCLKYWQCLPTHHIFLDCEDIGDVGDFEHTVQPNFWIQDGEITHHYMTRRNFDMNACQQWVDEWNAVLGQVETVCLSGQLATVSDSDDHPSSPSGTQYYWIIDRMKSRAGEWSYFVRKDAEE